MKQCYKCKITYPLFMFGKSDTPPIKTAQGRSFVCKICNFIESRNKEVCRKQKNGKFVVVKLTLKERIKELWN